MQESRQDSSKEPRNNNRKISFHLNFSEDGDVVNDVHHSMEGDVVPAATPSETGQIPTLVNEAPTMIQHGTSFCTRLGDRSAPCDEDDSVSPITVSSDAL